MRARAISWVTLSSRAALLSRTTLLTLAELTILAVWALFITQPYANLDPQVIPTGREYLSAIQTHHLWTRFMACGPCAMWNGSTNGGEPAFVDLHGSMLHPLVAVTTLLWGVLTGAKLALMSSFFLAGLAQWWLGHALGLGRPARLWSALLAVAGGQLAARMELGAFGVVLSTAACALVLPPLVMLARTASRRAAVLLGVTLALALLAGQGYMQAGLLFSLPAALWLLPRPLSQARPLLPRFALAGLLAVLLAAVFLVPFLHFLPQFGKPTDSGFSSAQPFAYVPLNLVISDPAFYWTNSLHKLPYPVLNANFIGWAAVLLAVFGLAAGRNPEERRAGGFLASSALLAMWLASAQPLRWLAENVPSSWLVELVSSVRNPPQIAGLAVAPLLGLAAIGLDRLLQFDWPRLNLELLSSQALRPRLSLSLRWLLLVPLLLALRDAHAFGQHWIQTTNQDRRIPVILAALETPDLQWVNTPFGEHGYIELAVSQGFKLASGFQTWFWKDHPGPEPVLEGGYSGPPPGMTAVNIVEGVGVYQAGPGREYARVTYPSGLEPTICRGEGLGGDIEVHCKTPEAGSLLVKENRWSGWRASIDGRPARLKPGQWLVVDLPAGSHTITFRYRPWDVPVGIFLSLVGLALAVYFWKYDSLRG